MTSQSLNALLEEDADDAQALAMEARAPIVVVEDDATVRRALELLLGERYQVTLCGSGQEGVAAVGPDTCAVVLDVRMKGYDGFWAYDEIRKRHPDVPVIFYSAFQDAKDPYRIINEHHPFGHVTKDGDSRELLEMLEVAVRLHRMTLDNKRLVEGLRRLRKPQP